MLDDAHVPYFHMREFAPSVGVFKSWKGNEKKRRKFLSELLNITVKYTEQSIAAGVLQRDWRNANRTYKLRENDFPPYSLCGQTCIKEGYYWCDERNHPRNQVVFVFEDDDEDKGALIRRAKKDFGIKLEFGEKVSNPDLPNQLPMMPLQAADFASWHVRRVLDRLAREGSVPRASVRYDFEELFSRVPYEGYHRYFSMTAAPPSPDEPTELTVLKRPLGLPSLVRFCAEERICRRK